MERKTQSSAATTPSGMFESLEDRRLMSVSYDAVTRELTVNGGAGNDTINIFRGGNFVSASFTDDRGSHSDTFFDLNRPVSRIRVFGLDGADRVRLDGPLPRTSVFGGLGDDVIDAGGITSNGTGAQTTWLVGNDGNDVITGSMFNDGLHGYAGNDSMTGGGGVDALFGWDGNDTLRGEDGDDWLYADAGNDSLDGGNGNDHLYGLDGNDSMAGGAGNDLMSGGAGGDTMFGGDGDDFFEGSRDGFNDFIFGGAGTDTHDGLDFADFWFPF